MKIHKLCVGVLGILFLLVVGGEGQVRAAEGEYLYSLMYEWDDFTYEQRASVEVVDLATMEHVRTLDFGNKRIASMEVSPDGSKLYLPMTWYNQEEGHFEEWLGVFDAVTGEELNRVKVNYFAQDGRDIVISPDGSKVYLLGCGLEVGCGCPWGMGQAECLGWGEPGGMGAVAVDTSNYEIVGEMHLNGAGYEAWGIGVSPDGETVGITGAYPLGPYSTNTAGFYIVDAASMGLEAEVHLVNEISSIRGYNNSVVFVNNDRAMIVDGGRGEVFQVDVANRVHLVDARITTHTEGYFFQRSQHGLVYSPITEKAYTTGIDDSRELLGVFDPFGVSYGLVGGFDGYNRTLVMTPDGRKVYVYVGHFGPGENYVTLNSFDLVSDTIERNLYQFEPSIYLYGFRDVIDSKIVGGVSEVNVIDEINNLIQEVETINDAVGISNSLDAKLESAVGALSDVNENNDVAAVNSLQAFINAVEAQRGNKLTDTQADDLITAAQTILALL